MITNSEEYFENIYKIGIPELAILLPGNENIYNINMNSRTVEAPEFLSVNQDHKAEMIYFIVDRFYDNVDLSTMSCIIQYKNANQEEGYYIVPFYDVETYAHRDPQGNILSSEKMLIPWCIEGHVTEAAGEVEFAFRFFKSNFEKNKLVYMISTTPAKSKVLYGMTFRGYYKVELTQELYEPNKYYIFDGKNYILSESADFDRNQTYYINTFGNYNFSEAMYNDLDLRLENILSKIASAEKDLSSVYWTDV